MDRVGVGYLNANMVHLEGEKKVKKVNIYCDMCQEQVQYDAPLRFIHTWNGFSFLVVPQDDKDICPECERKWVLGLANAMEEGK